jgi:hypothetical protein
MLDNSCLLGTHDTILIDSINHYVYQAILITYQKHPDWLREKFRNCPWPEKSFQNKFQAALTKKLNQPVNRSTIVEKTLHLLSEIFFPTFFLSNHFIDLILNIRQVTQSKLDIDNQTVKVFAHQNRLDSSFAILLLDAENLSLNLEIEKFLLEICTLPLTVKFAFANWRNLGGKDIDFHNRNYELIHVPAGKNSADLKMLSFGSSISLYYPMAKEVFVCSSDRDLNPLCDKLLSDGLTVYRVSRKMEEIIVDNLKTGETKIYSLLTTIAIPSLEDVVRQLKQIIREEQYRSKNYWIKLSRISNLFQERYKLSLSQVVAHHLPGKKTREIFQEFKIDFVTHQLLDNSHLYVTIFDVKFNETIENLLQKQPIATFQEFDIDSKEKLEEAIYKIAQSLRDKTKQDFVGIGEIATQFNKKYNYAITKTLQRLNLNKNFVKFLSTCEKFQIKQVNKNYQLTIN